MGIKERREREEQGRLEAILRAASSVFARKGYYETRMDDIALEAELAKGTLYYYYKSKDEIFVHLLERESEKVYEEIRRRLPDKASFLEIMDKVINFSVDYFESNQGFLKIFLPCMCGIVRLDDPLAVRRSTLSFDKHGEFIRSCLEKAVDRERLPFDLDDLLRFLKTMQMGVFLRLAEGSPRDARKTADFFLQLIKTTMEKHR